MRTLLATALLGWTLALLAPPAAAVDVAPADSSGNLRPKLEPHRQVSDAGGFSAVWPSGCAKLLTRVRQTEAGEPGVVDVTCRRFGDADRGCKVTVLKDFTPDRPPTPQIVVRNIEKLIRDLGLVVDHQSQITRHGHQGVAVFCHEKGGRRTLWVEGYVIGMQAVLVEAWDVDQRLLEDEQIKAFFDSVVLLEE